MMFQTFPLGFPPSFNGDPGTAPPVFGAGYWTVSPRPSSSDWRFCPSGAGSKKIAAPVGESKNGDFHMGNLENADLKMSIV